MRAARIAILGSALLAGSQSVNAACVGDCNADNVVAVNEIVIGVNIAVDKATLDTCPSFDSSSSGTVQVDELVTGVNNLLRNLCSGNGDPSPTPTIPVDNSPTPTATTPPVGDTPEPTATFGASSACSFSAANSALRLCFLGICAAPIAAAGELGVHCRSGTGSRDCNCSLRSFEPVEVSGIGFACIDGVEGTCPTGTQDCDGSTSVNIDLVADSDIGTCSSNAECATKCDAYCAALAPTKVRLNSGCENHCQAGPRLDLPCICDRASNTTCLACHDNLCVGTGQGCETDDDCAGVNDCPFSSCEGKDNERDVDCHCQCADEAFGDPTPAGALICRLPTAIRIERGSECDGNGVLIRLPPLCAPFTTGEASGILLQLDETPNAAEFDRLVGASTTCAALDGGRATGMTLVGNLAFFDSTVGDVISQLTLHCE